jgi:hypothetical protein
MQAQAAQAEVEPEIPHLVSPEEQETHRQHLLPREIMAGTAQQILLMVQVAVAEQGLRGQMHQLHPMMEEVGEMEPHLLLAAHLSLMQEVEEEEAIIMVLPEQEEQEEEAMEEHLRMLPGLLETSIQVAAVAAEEIILLPRQVAQEDQA